MIARHALWSGVASNRGYHADTPEKREALQLWNLVMICDRFKWTPEYVRSLSQSFMDDLIEICNVRDHYANKSSPSKNG